MTAAASSARCRSTSRPDPTRAADFPVVAAEQPGQPIPEQAATKPHDRRARIDPGRADGRAFERGVAAPGPVGVVDQAEHGPRVRVARFLQGDLTGVAGRLDTDSLSIRAIADAPPLPPCWAPP
jgi:hypothetical protein